MRPGSVVKRSGIAVVLMLVLLDADRAREIVVPGSQLDTSMRPKLLAIKVSGSHLVLVIFVSDSRRARQGSTHTSR